MSIKDQRMIALAMEEASKSTLAYKHGCIATSGGKIIARACNTNRSYQGSKTMNCMNTSHAEINVLRILEQKYKNNPRKLSRITLYIARIDRKKKGEMFLSAPCSDCCKKIKELNIKSIVYTCSENNIKKCSMCNFESNHISYGNRYLNNIIINNEKTQ